MRRLQRRPRRAHASVLAGGGTGLAGAEMRELVGEHLAGVDVSAEMLARCAAESGGAVEGDTTGMASLVGSSSGEAYFSLSLPYALENVRLARVEKAQLLDAEALADLREARLGSIDRALVDARIAHCEHLRDTRGVVV